MSGTHKNKIKNEQFLGESIYLADMEIRLLMELEGAVEGLLDLTTDVVLRLPSLLLLLLLIVKKFRGDLRPNDRIVGPMTGPLGRPCAEDILGGRNILGNPSGG